MYPRRGRRRAGGFYPPEPETGRSFDIEEFSPLSGFLSPKWGLSSSCPDAPLPLPSLWGTQRDCSIGRCGESRTSPLYHAEQGGSSPRQRKASESSLQGDHDPDHGPSRSRIKATQSDFRHWRAVSPGVFWLKAESADGLVRLVKRGIGRVENRGRTKSGGTNRDD